MSVFNTLTANPSFRLAIDRTPAPSEFKGLFDPVVEELADAWQEGTDEYIREHHPDLDAAERETRTATEQAWRRRDLPAFKEHLEEFRAAVMAEIEAFNGRMSTNEERRITG